MEPLLLILLGAGISVLAFFLWWYYPSLRKPWAPKLRRYTEKPHGDEPPSSSIRKPSLVVHKAGREMELYEGDKLVKTYRVALGMNPVDDKRKEGDGCTPEGEFYVCTKNDRSKFHLFMGLSYPNAEDAERGLESGLISRDEYARIVEAIAAKKRPPWDTRLGGEIGIHGEGSAVDWTRGGIALNNSDIEELFMVMKLGSPVRILP